jgi:hypothetical protein
LDHFPSNYGKNKNTDLNYQREWWGRKMKQKKNVTLSSRWRRAVLNWRTPRPLEVGSNLWAFSKA